MAIAREYRDFWEALRDLDRFFDEKDDVHKTLRRLAKRLARTRIPYPVAGGLAVFAHKHRRATNDVDILLTPAGLAEFRKRFVPKNYLPVPGRGRRFVDRVNEITIDFLLAGMFPGSGEPGPIAYPDPEEVSELIKQVPTVDLQTLIQLKLAARRFQDFADVVALIRHNELDESFRDRLHPSIRGDYLECLEEKRREDHYDARKG